MTTANKAFTSLLGLGLSLVLFSCNNDDSKKEDPAKMTDSTTTTTTVATPAPEAFKPFDVVEVIHPVKDYAAWRPAFDADSVNRIPAGIHDIAVGQEPDHPNNVLVALKVDNVQKAKDMMADPKMKAAMDKGGVIGKPNVTFWHVIRYDGSSHEKQWVVVTHKVKDFAAWLTAYDGEGTAARNAQGMKDVVIARDLADSNNVHLVFDISDMAKAKAALMSDDKKKLMQSAGVIGIPKMTFYNEN